MPQRRSRMPHKLLILGLIAAGAWGGWQFAPEKLRAALGGDAGRAHEAAEIDVCALATEPELAKTVNRVAIEARDVGQRENVPAAGVCGWEFFGGSVTGRVFTPASLRRGGLKSSGVDYYRSVITGLEYEYKEVPVPISGLGDDAAVSGGDQGLQQLVVRRGERVLTLEYAGIDRATAQLFAASLISGF